MAQFHGCEGGPSERLQPSSCASRLAMIIGGSHRAPGKHSPVGHKAAAAQDALGTHTPPAHLSVAVLTASDKLSAAGKCSEEFIPLFGCGTRRAEWHCPTVVP